MRILRSEEGAALVTALMLTMLSLVIAMALLSTVIRGAKVSASQKRYRSSLAAAHGGVELLTQELVPILFQLNPSRTATETIFEPIALQLPQYNCLQQKLNKPNSQWGAACNASSDPDDAPDVTFKLSGLPQEKGFLVSTKIVDSNPGNSDKNGSLGSDFLDPGIAVAGSDSGGVVRPQHVPGIYNISVQGVREGAEMREKARLSVLYAY
jgi:hypothetical protein